MARPILKRKLLTDIHIFWRMIEERTKKSRYFIRRIGYAVFGRLFPLIIRRNKKKAQHILNQSLSLPLKHYIANSIDFNSRLQLLIDVSDLIKTRDVTGTQRVGRSLLINWLLQQPAHWRIQPIYLTEFNGYKYAHHFTLKLLGHHKRTLHDVPICYKPGDVFLGLNCSYKKVIREHGLYQSFRDSGLKTSFLVHDLLPVLMPDYFHITTAQTHAKWLKIISQSAALFCVSKATADSLDDWITNNLELLNKPQISWFHLGADINNSVSSFGLPKDRELLSRLQHQLTFILVGTVEPRKGHRQTLAAFELLWQDNKDINLCFIGRAGWMMDSFIVDLQSHPQYGIHLFWIDDATDEYLRKLYQVATCLLFPSQGEGFGLPIIEAAYYGLPLLLRDLPVFREIAGEHASYFSGDRAIDLVHAINQWISQYERDQTPNSATMPQMTWEQSAEQLLSLILSEK